MGDGRGEGSSAIENGGQAAISLTPDIDGTHVGLFESSQFESSYVGDLLYLGTGEQKVSNKMNPNRTTTKHIIIKITKIKDREF